MSRKHYQAIAAALAANYLPIKGVDPVRDAIHRDYCHAVANALAADNARFDRARFLAACGDID